MQLSLENFSNHKLTSDRKMGTCKDCRKISTNLWYKNNRERMRRLQKEYREKNLEKVLEIEKKSREKNRESRLNRMRQYYFNLRNELFEAYGNKCACCGEIRREFFAVDHILGGGTAEKRKLGTRPLYRKIKAEGFPKDKYQILCHNCNMSLGFYGYCPHSPSVKRPIRFGGKPKS